MDAYLGNPLRGVLRVAFLCVVVNVGQAESGDVAICPLEVVEQTYKRCDQISVTRDFDESNILQA